MSDSTNVIMPQIGEGISEATIIAWHKKIGDAVEEGETLLDVSTAKIDIEIPAPVEGVLAEIRFPDEATVPVDTVIAVIAPKGTEVEAPPPQASPEKEDLEGGEDAVEAADMPEPPASPSFRRGTGSAGPSDVVDTETHRRNMLRKRSTPMVRRMARELGIDLSAILGTGLHGRVTRQDLEAYLERKQGLLRAKKAEAKAAAAVVTPPPPREGDKESEPEPEPVPLSVGERRSEPMSNMRKMIAEHMQRSYRRSPHAFTSFEFDFTRAERLRLRHREAFHRQVGVKLTPLCFVIKAIADVLPRFPIITAFLREEEIVYPSEINIGVAVAIPNGLLVPVVHEVEGKSIEELSKGLHDVATRARQGKLVLADVEGGTFTVTSPGQQGCLMGIPIINQPQSAILHIGAITKQPSVVTNGDGEDSIAIRSKAILTLGFDHRLIDGWEADSFMSAVRERIEIGDFVLEQYV